MTEFNYEGAIDNISPQQLQYVTEVLKENGFSNCKVVFEAVGEASDNFTSYVKRIVIDTKGKTFKMIAKFATTQENMRLGNTTRLFMNEIIMYTEVLPKFRQLEETAKIPEKHRLRYAKCYGAYKEAPNEVIVLEDLQLYGFTMLDKSIPLSHDCVKCVLQNFAKIHSLSYVLKINDCKKFEEFKNNLFDIWQNLDIESVKYSNYIKEQAVAVLEDEKQKEVFVRNTSNDITDTIYDVNQEYKHSKYTVILQGDPWTNNIMFKSDSKNFVECIMIDYQVSRVNIPPADLMYLIFICTDHATRLKYFISWIEYYHMELAQNLRYHGLDVNSIYSRDQLQMDLRKYGKAALGVSTYITYITILSPDDALKAKEYLGKGNDLLKSDLSDGLCSSETMARFKEKLEGIIDSFVEFGLL